MELWYLEPQSAIRDFKVIGSREDQSILQEGAKRTADDVFGSRAISINL
jgi:hypothetical protein